MIAAAPFPSQALAGWRLRAAMAVILGIAAAPTAATSTEPLHNWGALIPIAGTEILIGVCFGLAIRLLWSGLLAGGSIASRMVGIRSATDEGGETPPPVGHIASLAAVAALLVAGGHRPAIGAFLDSFRLLPPGGAVSLAAAGELVIDLLQSSFQLAIGVAAPAAMCVLLAWAAQGVLLRIMPRSDVYAFGFAGQATALIAGFWISLGAASLLFSHQVAAFLELVSPSLQQAS